MTTKQYIRQYKQWWGIDDMLFCWLPFNHWRTQKRNRGYVIDWKGKRNWKGQS